MTTPAKSLLVLGASRGLGLGLVQEYLQRGWNAVGTIRSLQSAPGLVALRDAHPGRVEIATLDITVPADLTRLRDSLHDRQFDLLFVNAGVANDPKETIGQISTEEFVRVMVTNTLSPMRALETLIDLVLPSGTAAMMSSGLGSVANNETGGWETYRASKAGLNTLMRSFTARRAGDSRTYLIVAPGWVRTDMGGPNARLDVETSMRGVADAIAQRSGHGGLAYVDYTNTPVRW